MRSGSSGHLLLQCTVFLTVLATSFAAARWGDRNGGYGGNGGGNGVSNGGNGGYGGGGRGGGGRTGFGGFSGEESRCNQTCSNGALPIGGGNWTLGGPPPPPQSCADGSLPLCSCNNGSRPTCGDGSVPRLTPPCADGSLPACPAATNPTPAATNATIQIGQGGRLGRSPHFGGHDRFGGPGGPQRCLNGAQPVCQNGATPVFAPPCASNGGGPVCADGSYVSRHG